MSICVAICNLGLAKGDKLIHGDIKQGLTLADNRFVIGRLGVRVSPPAPSASLSLTLATHSRRRV